MKIIEQNQRNRAQSKQVFINAVSTIIRRNGFKGIGINAIAKEAKLDKVLIYRYFDGLNGLLREFAKQKDFYINISDSIRNEIEKAQKHELKEVVFMVLKEQLRELRANSELQELMLWEMVEKNELTDAIAKAREEKGYALSKQLKKKMDGNDQLADAVIALLVSGIYYLVLRMRTVDQFNGINLHSEDGWRQIETAIQVLVNTYFEPLNS